MISSANRLRLFGLIQDLQKQAAELGMSRTAAALEVTGAVAMEEVANHTPSPPGESEDALDDVDD